MCRHSVAAASYGGFAKLHLLIVVSSSYHESANLRLEKPYAHNQSVPQAPNQPRPPWLCCPRAAPRLHPVSSYFITLLTRVSPALAMYRITLSSLNSCAIFHLACLSSSPAYPQSSTFLGRLLISKPRLSLVFSGSGPVLLTLSAPPGEQFLRGEQRPERTAGERRSFRYRRADRERTVCLHKQSYYE